jgi:hypothetical protein
MQLTVNNPAIRRRPQAHIDESNKMATASSQADYSNSIGVDAELNPLVAPFQISVSAHVDDEKKSMSIFPRSFYGRRRLVVVTVCAFLVVCMFRMFSHGKVSFVFPMVNV